MVYIPLISAFRRPRQADLWWFEASLVYIVSSRVARVRLSQTNKKTIKTNPKNLKLRRKKKSIRKKAQKKL